MWIKALRRHLIAAIVEYGHVVLYRIDLLECQHVANPDIMGNGKIWSALIQDGFSIEYPRGDVPVTFIVGPKGKLP
jgi:hypothetical protein